MSWMPSWSHSALVSICCGPLLISENCTCATPATSQAPPSGDASWCVCAATKQAVHLSGCEWDSFPFQVGVDALELPRAIVAYPDRLNEALGPAHC